MAWVLSIGLLGMAWLFWRMQGRAEMQCAIGIVTVFLAGMLTEQAVDDLFGPAYDPAMDLLLVCICFLAMVAILLYWGPRVSKRGVGRD